MLKKLEGGLGGGRSASPPWRLVRLVKRKKREFMHARLINIMHAFLPSFLASFLASFLPCFLPCFLPSFLASFLPSFLAASRSWKKNPENDPCTGKKILKKAGKFPKKILPPLKAIIGYTIQGSPENHEICKLRFCVRHIYFCPFLLETDLGGLKPSNTPTWFPSNKFDRLSIE